MGDSSHSLVMDSEVKLDDDNHVLVEASADLPLRETASYDLEGQNENGFIVGENSFSETEDSSTEYDSCRSEDPTFDSGNHSQRPLETSTNASLGENGLNGGDEMVNIAIESAEGLLAKGETEENGLNGGDEMVNVALESADDLLIEGETWEKGLNSGDEIVDIAIESSDDFLVAGETSQNFQFEDNNVATEDTSSAEVFIIENDYKSSNIDSALSSNDDSSVPIELSSLSLEERVANFMQYGHLDTVEEDQFVTYTSEHSEKVPNGGNGAITSNESAEKSLQLVPSTTGNSPFRDDDLSAERQSAQFSKNLDVKTSKRENRVEISHLKFMLHQKELELSRLKEQIEKEKHDLSVLQANAQSEISKAQQLISEKDAELHAAEETLSGLVEVHIQYHGDGDIVEVAGSFNGWHHWIKMDPQPSSSIIDSVGPRKSKIWSTVLWLYPGVYEIKFIVDGEWKIDPQRESVTRGYICNNILRVDR
ncbi:protein PTST homolog 3, chloroplastic [Morus notabilis]|nr:protein PTST homolog 3, chloroplastic [Morus notabilis]